MEDKCRGYAGGVPIYCAHDKVVPIAEVKPNPKNPNQHPEEQIELLAKIIKTQGWRAPVTVSTLSGLVVRGHGRLMAAQFLGLDCVPVDFQHYSCYDAELADLLADNKIAELAEIDSKILSQVFQDIDSDAIDIDITGYSEEEYNDIISALMDATAPEPGDLDPEDAVEVQERAVSRYGDVWLLGNHRLMCGDSTNAEDADKLMDGVTADICFTSPPYNAGSLNIAGEKGTQAKYNSYDDNKTAEEYYEFIRCNLQIMLDNAKEVFYNIGLVENNKREIILLQKEFIKQFKDIIYWKKATVAPHIQPGIINNLVEFILCFGNGKRKFENAQFSQGTYWNVIEGPNASGNQYSDIHKATFPLYLPTNIVENFCPKNGTVIDCFGGTGTTLIACEQLHRICYMMELDPRYVDVIVKRYIGVTGKTDVTLLRDGEEIPVEETGIMN